MISDLSADGDRCQHCGRPLHRHYGGKHTRRTLREWDGDVVFATMVDVWCEYCGAVTSIFGAADMLPPVSTPRRGRWAWAAAG
jgi:ribosomal protein S27E